jgi:hypothetical protein
MIEMFVFLAEIESRYEMEREKRWHDEFMKADPLMRKIMLEHRERDRKEAIEERRHREIVQAQKDIADAIRSASRRSYFYD